MATALVYTEIELIQAITENTAMIELGMDIRLSDPGQIAIENKDNPIIIVGNGYTIHGQKSASTAGSVFWIEDSTVTLEHMRITDGLTTYGGGGISATGSTVSLTNVTIVANQATGNDVLSGGGISVSYSTINMVSCVISENIALSSSSSIGGGIFAVSSNIFMLDCIISENIATSGLPSGGGIYLDEGYLDVRDSRVLGNKVTNGNDDGGNEAGGSIYIRGSQHFFGVYFSDNVPYDFYGGQPICDSSCLAGQFGNKTGCATIYNDDSGDDSSACTCPMFSGCLPCLAGKFMTNDYSKSSQDCTDCGAGLFSPSGATTCTSCPKGTFASDASAISTIYSGATTCKSCAAGTFGPYAGMIQCQQCAAGETSGTNSTSCYPCPAGKSSYAGNASCYDCKAGKYNDAQGNPFCTDCKNGDNYGNYGPNYWSEAGSTVCDACVNGYYFEDNDCKPCPAGSTCDSYYQVLKTLQINPGYYRFSGTSTELYKCPYNDAACPGSSDITNGNATAKGALCSKGHKGPLCAICEDGYALNEDSTKCSPCEGALYGKTAGVAVGFVLFCAGVAAVLWYCFRESIQKLRKWAASHEALMRLMASQLTTVAVTIQTGMLISENHEAAGGEAAPKSYQEITRWFDFVALNISLLPAGCFVSFGYFAVLALQTVGTIFVGLSLYFMWRYKCLIGHCSCRQYKTNKLENGGTAHEPLLPDTQPADEEAAIESPTAPRGGGAPEIVTAASARGIEEKKKPNDAGIQEESLGFVQENAFGFEEGGLAENESAVPGNAALQSSGDQASDSTRRQCGVIRLRGSAKRPDYIVAAITFVKFVLPVVSLEIAAAFSCESYKVGQGESDKTYLTADFQVDCSSWEYRLIFAYAIAMMIIFPIGVPTYSLVLLFLDRRRHRLRSSTAASRKGQVSRTADDEQETDSTPHYSVLGAILVRDVKPEYWFMEVVDMIRRLMLTCMPVAFSDSYAEVIVFSLAVTLIGLVIQTEFQPYKLDATNTVKVMEAWQNLLCVIVLLIKDADMFKTKDGNFHTGMYNLAGIGMVLIDGLMIAVIISSAWKKGAYRIENFIGKEDEGEEEEGEEEERRRAEQGGEGGGGEEEKSRQEPGAYEPPHGHAHEAMTGAALLSIRDPGT